MRHRRAALVAFTVGNCWMVGACGGDAPPAQVGTNATAAGTTFVGCVAQTGQPDVFLLSVVQARDAQAQSPAGSVVPRADGSSVAGAPGAGTPAPVATGGGSSAAATQPPSTGNPSAAPGPGSGPTSTTKIDTYRLAGTGGLDLRQHVGHTLEVRGSIQALPGELRLDGTTPLMGELRVESARAVADECVR